MHDHSDALALCPKRAFLRPPRQHQKYMRPSHRFLPTEMTRSVAVFSRLTERSAIGQVFLVRCAV